MSNLLSSAFLCLSPCGAHRTAQGAFTAAWNGARTSLAARQGAAPTWPAMRPGWRGKPCGYIAGDHQFGSRSPTPDCLAPLPAPDQCATRPDTLCLR